MKMLPTLAPDTSVTENGHYLVRPTEKNGPYEVVSTVTDEVYTTTDDDGVTTPARFNYKASAAQLAVELAQQNIDNA